MWPVRTIFDLPSHAFFIHLPLVLVPVTALAMLALAIRPSWRRRYGFALVVATLIGAVGTIVAAASGAELNDALRDRIGDLADEHQTLGETTRLLSVLFFVSVLAMASFDRWGGGRGVEVVPDEQTGGLALTRNDMIGWGLAALSLVLGALAAVWMFRTGHEGSRIVWEGVIT